MFLPLFYISIAYIASFSPRIYSSQQHPYTSYSQQFLGSIGERGDREGAGIGIGVLQSNFAYPGNVFLLVVFIL